jgi:DNA polymerase III delta prime subunit
LSKTGLWVEDYRPKTLQGYVFKDAKFKSQIDEWIKNTKGEKIPIPHILLTGGPGTGKTTIARALLNELGVNKYDILEFNGSNNTGVDHIRDVIKGFCGTWPNGDYKVVHIEEADYLSQTAQAVLRAEIELHSDTARFILTGNYPHKIIPALHSRLHGFHFAALDMESYIGRLVEILSLENVNFNFEDLQLYINSAYPDLRKCINLLQQNTIDGKLVGLTEATATTQDYLLESIALFQNKQYQAARKMIVAQAQPEEYEEIFRFFYKNLDFWSSNEHGQGQAIIAIAKGLRNHGLVADAEINLSATLIELGSIE